MALPIAGLLKGAGAVKNLTGGGEKKAKKEKLLPATKEGEGEKQLPGKKSSALAVRPKTKIAPRVRVTSFKSIAPKGGRLGKGGALVYDDLSSRLDTLVQNTNILKQFAKNDLENQKEETKAKKQTAEKAKNAAAESKAEAKAEQKTLKMSLKAPKMDIFGGVFKILRNIAFGTLVMETLRFFSDPEKSKTVLKFVEDNMLTILSGMGAAIAAVVIAPLFGPGAILLGALKAITSVTMILGGFVLKSLLHPVLGPAIGFYLLGVTYRSKRDERIRQRLEDAEYGNALIEAEKEKQKTITPEIKETVSDPAKVDKLNDVLGDYLEKQGVEVDESVPTITKPTSGGQFWGNIRNRIMETLYGKGKSVDFPSGGVLPKAEEKTEVQPTETKIPGVSLGEAAGYSERRGRVHAGRDIPASSGQPLIVQTDSIIQDTGYDPGYGNYVVFKDANGLEHMYGHMIAPTTYRKGDAVSAGTVVGNVGSTGRSSGPHLHWEVSPNIGEVGFKRSNVFDPILDYGFNQNSPFASGNLATKKPESQAAEIAKQTSYEEPGDQEVLVTMPPPAAPPVMPSSGGGGIAMPQRASMETVLNNYYRFQVLGFLYKQG